MSKLESAPLFETEYVPIEGVPTNPHVGFWKRKVTRPAFDKLKSDIHKLGFTGAGRKYGVSDNAVRKWLKGYQTQEQGKTVDE